MTDESNKAIAVDMFSHDWLKNLVPNFQPMRGKAQTNRALNA